MQRDSKKVSAVHNLLMSQSSQLKSPTAETSRQSEAIAVLSKPKASASMSVAQQLQIKRVQEAAIAAQQGRPPGNPPDSPTDADSQPDSPPSGDGGRRLKRRMEERGTPSEELSVLRKRICMRKLDALRILTEVCYDSMRELFFLQKGFNLMDNYFTWKKKANPELQAFLMTSNFDSDEELSDDDRPLICETAKSPMDTSILSAAVSPVGSPQPMSQPLTPQILLPGGVIACKPAAAAADSPQSPLSRAMLTKLNRTLSPPRHATRQQALSSVIDQSTGASTDAIVERAKQEAQVLQRVAELRKDGMWSAKRLPKVREPPRSKAHWDYLLEEIQWLATDFVQERKWKKAAAKKISTAILRYHKEKELKVQSAEKDEYKRLRRIASNIAKDVRQFWSNIEKVVHYKQQSRFDEQRKKALDMHLNFIVDQTEKYSTWLTEGLRNDNTPPMSPASPKMSSQQESILADDEDFQYESGESADDEETIAKAELEDDVDPMDELDALQRESEMPIEDLISTLPAEMLDPNAPPLRPSKGKPEDEGSESESDDSAATGRSLTTLMEGAGQESRKRKRDEDSDYTASQSEEEESDDERTIEKEERIAAGQDDAVDEELSDLKNEGDMSIDELYAKYAAAYDEDFEMPVSESEVTTSEDQSEEEQASNEEEEEEEEEESDDPEEQEEIGMEYLLSPKPEPPTDELPKNKDPRSPNRDITDIAAAAQSLQPTGYTLETTKVKTPVPFLLRHQLREYQHVGLEWLVTMYDSKLNGILADEMGLGKTIQTIATLAHLACEKGVWGPHLVVTPTSVMLNWEMEFKKWSPGFKILTYYGTPKERRMKRQGWTKVNAFHVCITSYKIVIQDHAAFRRKKWKYLILDEAQNIKNFKSQRWQTLLNFQSQRRLLLTGTPLQNSLMELWSLMHFLMPHVFASHREFRDWFSNPLQNMVEGSQEFNESLVRRLHKVLRPFILRRLKLDVEKQMPKKYEHVIMCRLSKRQRFLYDEFMHQTKTRETLASGSFMGVINILMQLRKVCNHPDLFDPRPVVSPLVSEGLVYHTPALVLQALRYDPLKDFNPEAFQLNLALHEQTCSSLNAKRWNQLKAPRRLIEEIDSMPEPPKRPRPIKLKFNLKEPAAPPGQVPVAQQMPLPGQTANPRPSIASIAQSLKLGVPATTEAATPPATQTLSAPVTPTSQSLSQSLSFNIQGNRFIIPQHQLKNLPPNIVHLLQSSAGSQLIAKTAGAAGPSLGGAQVIVGTTTSSAVATALTAATLTTVAQAPPKVTTSVSTVPASSPRPAAPIQRPATAVTLPTVSSSVPTQVKPVVRVAPMSGGAGLAPVRPEHPPASMQQQQPSQHPAARSETPSAAAATTSSAPVPMDVTPAARAFASAYVNRPPRTEYYIDRIAQRQEEARRQKLSRLADLNEQRCSVEPVFGYDLVHTVQQLLEPCVQCQAERTTWLSDGFAACKRVQTMRSQQRDDWNHTSLLDELVPTNEIVLNRMKDTTDRFVMYNPKAITPAPRLHCSRLISEQQSNELRRSQLLAHEVSPRMAPYHSLSNGMLTQFPDKRLIQYDCGKLQTMDILLRQLKSEAHRVLIFTQMSRMLDILETFLNYHGHTYVRLDGTTKVEQRQMLMDRFNNDRRIFVFILSTRSGGIGVNLTGADTVIFYDSDWNPTMDAQAQDRCHRIGQTRDVHIYRLISERSVEENILKKANQKRLLGDMAIEGGNFTTAYFKKHSINELFDQPTGLDELAKEKALQQQQRPSEETATVPAVTQTMFEAALAGAEEETDVLATRNLTAEVKAELAEFDENIPWEEDAAAAAAAAAATAAGGAPSTSTADPVTSAPPPSKVEELPEISRVEQELAMLDNELTPIERYAVCYIESQMGPVEEDDMQLAEEELENAKREWELGRLQQIKEEEEFRAEYEEDEILFTYSNEDAKNQVTKKARPKGRPPLQAGAKGPTLAGAGARRRADRDDEPGEIDIMSADDSLAATGTNPRLHRGPAAFGTPPIGARARVQTPRRLSSEPNGLANETSPSPRSIGALGGPRWNKFSGEAALKRPRGRPRLVRRSEEDTGDLSPEALPKSPPAQVARPPVSSPASAPQAWSNPNLVIRTRRARLSQSAAGDTP